VLLCKTDQRPLHWILTSVCVWGVGGQPNIVGETTCCLSSFSVVITKCMRLGNL
jgi:hypothetical protein